CGARGVDRDRALTAGRGAVSAHAAVAGARVLRVGVDARSLQPGFREDSARGIGVYARELVRALAARHDVALTLWVEPALRVADRPAARGRPAAPLRARAAAAARPPGAAVERARRPAQPAARRVPLALAHACARVPAAPQRAHRARLDPRALRDAVPEAHHA